MRRKRASSAKGTKNDEGHCERAASYGRYCEWDKRRTQKKDREMRRREKEPAKRSRRRQSTGEGQRRRRSRRWREGGTAT